MSETVSYVRVSSHGRPHTVQHSGKLGLNYHSEQSTGGATTTEAYPLEAYPLADGCSGLVCVCSQLIGSAVVQFGCEKLNEALALLLMSSKPRSTRTGSTMSTVNSLNTSCTARTL